MARAWVMVLALALTLGGAAAGPVMLKNGGYEGIVVAIDEDVPADGCRNVLNSLEMSLSTASSFLHAALDGRAYLASVTVLLPSTWPDNCAPRYVHSATGETADVRVGPPHPVFGDAAWTQQPAGCREPGDFIFVGYQQLLQSKNIGRALAREWAKYRYGVFDEIGYHGDPVYPVCYRADEEYSQVTGCSDLRIDDQGLCANPGALRNVSALVQPDARSSVLFAAESTRVTRFCDEHTHNRFAPTKHNLLIGEASLAANTTPSVQYKRRSHTRYVLVIEETMGMLVRESWSYLRFAVRKWAVYDLPSSSEVGLVLSNETSPNRLHQLSPLISPAARDLVAANIPYTPVDSHAPACLHCGIREALDMLKERTTTHGPASSVIVVIAPGMDHVKEVNALLPRAISFGVKIATINYPHIQRPSSLDSLAHATGGVAYTVMEERYNMAISFVSTYFKLANVMFSIATRFYEGRPNGMPVEIHRRELTDENRSSVTGSFVLDESLGEPARFAIFTHSTDNPLIRSISLVSPSQFTYSTRSDSLALVKMLTLQATINETGTWTYYIERYSGNPQPHYVQVMATPRTSTAPVVRARAWTSKNLSPLVLYAEVKKGDYPVMGAKVEVIVTRPGRNGTQFFREKFEMLDTGSGDPDVTKGDGIYSRYFSAAGSATGLYTFEIIVTDNGNTAYSWQDNLIPPNGDSGPVCCGSAVPPAAAQPLQPFQRVLPPISIIFKAEDVMSQPILGRIGDLRARVIPSELKARLHWTAPDMGGVNVQRYELRYAYSAADIIDRFETMGRIWEYGSPFSLAAGSDTMFNLEFTKNPSLLDQPLYFRLRAFADKNDDASGGPISNWVRVLVPSPPPPPPPPSTSPNYTPDLSSWSYDGDDDAAVVPRIAQGSPFTLELILPIVGGIALLAVCIAVYCYVCVLRRRHGNSDKKSNSKDKHAANGKQQVTPSGTAVTIMPSAIPNSNSNTSLSQQPAETTTVNMSPQFEHDQDEKKRFSVAQLQQEEQLLQQQHEQMIQQQQQQQQQQTPQQQPQPQIDMSPNIVALPSPNNISTISSGGSNTLVRGRTLSPYQSWTASQLLHEHERRHSPYGGMADEGIVAGGSHAQLPPPVPPLPTFNSNHNNGIYSSSGPIYGVHPGALTNGNYHRNGSLVPFNPSLQGSLSSVSSGDRKKRNVTMV
ncbi:Uncharacterized protein GBIM_04671 [Gryllus bimaculatus]|nr:Uncharacterized protein GBIM_04671 [Gryllus bimaculatus]